jgi:TetR/AcrR family transcriptional repressor of nem operon
MARPRTFEEIDVLEKATREFWRRGFTGTSYTHLTRATGLTKASLYNAFGNKEALFIRVLEHYSTSAMSGGDIQRGAGDRIRQYILHLADVANDQKTAAIGCLIMNSCVEFGREKTPRAKAAQGQLAAVERHFAQLFEEAIRQGDITNGKSADYLAEVAVAGVFAMREMAKFRPVASMLQHVAESLLISLGLGVVNNSLPNNHTTTERSLS